MIGDELEPMRKQERSENKMKKGGLTDGAGSESGDGYGSENTNKPGGVKPGGGGKPQEFDKAGKYSGNRVTFKNPKPQEFVQNITEAKKSNANGWAVDAHSVDDYANNKLITTSDGYNGVAVEPDGNIVSVYKHSKSTVRGVAKYLLAEAVKNGGDRLDAYGPVLYDIYAKNGFAPVSWIKWDNRFAPPDWTEKDQRQDIVFYKYVGVGNVSNESYEDFKLRVAVSSDYDTAQVLRDKSIGDKKNV